MSLTYLYLFFFDNDILLSTVCLRFSYFLYGLVFSADDRVTTYSTVVFQSKLLVEHTLSPVGILSFLGVSFEFFSL